MPGRFNKSIQLTNINQTLQKSLTMKNNKPVNLFFLGRNYLRSSLILLMCLLFNNMSAQQKMISGNVVDETGIPLPGANVIVKGSTKSTQTDFDGNFTIEANSNSTLVFPILE